MGLNDRIGVLGGQVNISGGQALIQSHRVVSGPIGQGSGQILLAGQMPVHSQGGEFHAVAYPSDDHGIVSEGSVVLVAEHGQGVQVLLLQTGQAPGVIPAAQSGLVLRLVGGHSGGHDLLTHVVVERHPVVVGAGLHRKLRSGGTDHSKGHTAVHIVPEVLSNIQDRRSRRIPSTVPVYRQVRGGGMFLIIGVGIHCDRDLHTGIQRGQVQRQVPDSGGKYLLSVLPDLNHSQLAVGGGFHPNPLGCTVHAILIVSSGDP